MRRKDIRRVARDAALQSLCRDYLGRLRHVADKHGLGDWLRGLIKSNRRGECRGTEHEVAMLSRLCDDERAQRQDVPRVLGMSYRKANDGGFFDKVKRLRHVGVYSKIGALLLGSELKALSDDSER